ncbi:hypothetical protein MPLA_140026 [Mesorhizobium sp. ORS 3359]|nr:hypothetical protein MPLA_140026 [Mesorhizobium sp. ORS 3359]
MNVLDCGGRHGRHPASILTLDAFSWFREPGAALHRRSDRLSEPHVISQTPDQGERRPGRSLWCARTARKPARRLLLQAGTDQP